MCRSNVQISREGKSKIKNQKQIDSSRKNNHAIRDANNAALGLQIRVSVLILGSFGEPKRVPSENPHGRIGTLSEKKPSRPALLPPQYSKNERSLYPCLLPCPALRSHNPSRIGGRRLTGCKTHLISTLYMHGLAGRRVGFDNNPPYQHLSHALH